MGETVFETGKFPETAALTRLVEQIEVAGSRAIASHRAAIEATNEVLREDSQAHFYIVVSAIVVSVFLMGFVAYQLNQRILKPIDALTDAAVGIGDGNWDTTDNLRSSKGEIARLESAFVEMAGRIREYQRLSDKQVARTSRRMEECFSNLPNPVIFLNANREIAYRNPAAVELLREVSWEEAIVSLHRSTGGEFICVKRWADGAALWREGDGKLIQGKADAVEVADTIGAGDSFTAALATGILDGLENGESLNRTLRLSSFVASKSGAQPKYDASDVLA